MAILRLFPTDAAVPMSDTAKARIAERAQNAPILRDALMSQFYTGEAYGPERDDYVDPATLMTPPAEVRWGPNFLDKTCEDMGRNVLEYRALCERAKDVGEHLPGEWVAGEPGDPESETAKDEVEIAWNAIEELTTAMRGMGEVKEKGFRGGELIWDVLNRGPVRDYIAPIAIIPRPVKWFGFDYFGRPRFRRDASHKGDRDLPIVPDFKVLFSRMGDLHTPYGHGDAIDAYPTVFTIDENNKKMAKILERSGYLPMVVTYPQEWPDHGANVARLKAAVKSHWKNFIIVPGEVSKVEYRVEGAEAAYAGANATVAGILNANKALVESMAHFIVGTMQSSGNQQEGSYARELVASTDLMFKAPTYAGAREAMCNRLVKMLMFVNRPTLEEHKWPRRVIDSSFGEDLRLFSELCESGVRMGVRIAAVTWSERTGIPIAANDEENVLDAPAATNPFTPELPAAAGFSEPTVRIHTKHGIAELPPDFPLMIEGRGPTRASQVRNGMTIVGDPARLRLVR